MLEVEALERFIWCTEAAPFELVDKSELVFLATSARIPDSSSSPMSEAPSEPERRRSAGSSPCTSGRPSTPYLAYVPRLHRRMYRLAGYPLLFRTFAEFARNPRGVPLLRKPLRLSG